MHAVLQVQTTTDSAVSAQAIARDLVEQRLAACVQVAGPITSTYRWKDQVETATEWICIAKTTSDLYPRLEQRIRQTHHYDEPEILAIPVVEISASYGRWLRDQLCSPGAE